MKRRAPFTSSRRVYLHTPTDRAENVFSTRVRDRRKLVWYDSPFGPPEWMERTQAQRLLDIESPKFERMREMTGGELLYPPRIVERTARMRELSEQFSEEIAEFEKSGR